MLNLLRTSSVLLMLLTVLTGGVYPLVITLFAQTCFPAQSQGSLLIREGRAVGSTLIGQPFQQPHYFWGRLSATAPVPYHASASGGSNLGPLHPDRVARAEERLQALRAADAAIEPVPIDLVTASGSGLDPHISPAAALIQVPRVARVRGIEEPRLRDLIDTCTTPRQFGILGEPAVNVLLLNLALDAQAPFTATKPPSPPTSPAP